MYRLAVLILVATCASASVAQPTRPATLPPAGTAPNQTGLNADGKIMLGLDGRGNYRKPRVARNARTDDNAPANPQAANASAFRQALQAPQRGTPPNQQAASPSAAAPAPTAAQPVAVAPVSPTAPVAPVSPAAPVATATPAAPAIPNRPPVLPNALPALQPNGGLFTDAMR